MAASQYSECWFGKALNQAFLVTRCSKDSCTISHWDVPRMPCPLLRLFTPFGNIAKRSGHILPTYLPRQIDEDNFLSQLTQRGFASTLHSKHCNRTAFCNIFHTDTKRMMFWCPTKMVNQAYNKNKPFLDLLRNSLSQNQEMAIFLLNTGRSGRSNCPPVQLHAVGWHRYPVINGRVTYRWTIEFLKFFLYQHLPKIIHPFTWNNSMSCNM